MELRLVLHIACRGLQLHNRVHTGFQPLQLDAAVDIGHAVEIMCPVFNFGDTEGSAGQILAGVGIVLHQQKVRFFRVGEYEGGIFIGIDLHNAHGIIDQVALRSLQFPHLIGAGVQLADIDLAIGVGDELLGIAPTHLLELETYIGDGFHRLAIQFDEINARLLPVDKHQCLSALLAGLQLDLLGSRIEHMVVIGFDFLHQIGAGFQIVKHDFSPAVRLQRIEELTVLVDLKGDTGHPVTGYLINFDDPQAGVIIVLNSQDRVVLRLRIVGIHIDTVTGAVQLVSDRGDGLLKLVIALTGHHGEPELTGVIGGGSIDQFPILVDVEGCPGEGDAGDPIHLGDDDGGLTDILEGQGNIPGTVPVHRLHTGVQLVTHWCIDLKHTIATIGQLVTGELNHSIESGGTGGFIVAIDLLKLEHSALQRSTALLVDLLDDEVPLGVILDDHMRCLSIDKCDVSWLYKGVSRR